MGPFPYPPVNSNRGEIRILQPILSTEQQPIAHPIEDPTACIAAVPDLSLKFELVTVCLDEKPSFTALSYVWGESQETCAITVNGRPFQVGLNLQTALRHFEYRDIAPGIWIDSICINQQDLAEKSAQIPMMRSIYSSAAHVVVWLGDATDHSDFLAGAIRSFGNVFRRRFEVPTPQKYSLFDYFDSEILEDSGGFSEFISECLRGPEVENPTVFTIDAFISLFLVFATFRPWWYRVWVIQEFVFARKIFFQAGLKKIAVDEYSTLLTVAITMLYTNRLLSMQSMTKVPGNDSPVLVREWGWPMYMLVYRERRSVRRSAVVGMYHALCQTYMRPSMATAKKDRLLGATLKHDHIYALIGLFEEEWKSSGLTTDYTKSWQAVYTEVAEYLLSAGHLDLLAFCQHANPFQQNVPSWSPIWHEPIAQHNIWFKTSPGETRTLLGNSLYSASGNTAIHVTFVSVDGPSSQRARVMKISGIKVDTILEAERIYLRPNTVRDSASLAQLYGWLFRDIEKLCSQSRKLGSNVYSPSALKEARWRIPIRDHEVDIDSGEDDAGYQRASRLSKARFYRYLPYFKAARAGLDYQDLRGRDPSIYIGGKLIRFCYAMVYRWLFYTNIFEFYLLHFVRSVYIWTRSKFKSVFQFFLTALGVDYQQLAETPGQYAEFSLYAASMQALPMRPFITRRGFIGLGPPSLEPGDDVCVLYGARVPHILRQMPEGQRGSALVGEAFVYGAMDGEMVHSGAEEVEFEVY